MKTIFMTMVVALIAAAPADAERMSIQITGMDLTYDGSTLVTQSNPDELTSVVVTQSDGSILVIAEDIDIELNIPGVAIPIANPVSSTISAPGGSLILNVAGNSLQLDLGPAAIAHTDLGSIEFAFGAAPTTVISQNLPFGSLCDPVSLSFSQTIDAGTLTDNGVNVTGFSSFGTGEIIAVPEPISIVALLSFVGIPMLRLTRRRDC